VKQLSIEETQKIVLEAAGLNERGKFREAIDLLRKTFDGFHPVLRIEGLCQVQKAAERLGDKALAEAVQEQISSGMGDVSSIWRYWI
jgi:hypothetical protein